MRRGEILGLRWKDIDFVKQKISIRQTLVQSSQGIEYGTPKTAGSERTINVSGKTIDVLKGWQTNQKEEYVALGVRPGHGLVFTSEAGTPLLPRNLKRNYDILVGKADVPGVTFHTLRDTYANLQLESGMHLKAVAQALGHTNETMLLTRYAHALPGLQKEAAGKLDDIIPT